MGIRQLNGTYIPAEDRIVLRVSTDAGEEFRFWLTRPVTAHFLAANRSIVVHTIAQKFPPQVAQTVTEFEQQAVAQQTKLDDQFVPGATFPLGEMPALVVKLNLTPVDTGVSLDLGLPNGASVNLRFTQQLSQQVAVLLDRLQNNANWQIAAAAAPAAPPASDADSDKKLMH
jgi:hypothetical protein